MTLAEAQNVIVGTMTSSPGSATARNAKMMASLPPVVTTMSSLVIDLSAASVVPPAGFGDDPDSPWHQRLEMLATLVAYDEEKRRLGVAEDGDQALAGVGDATVGGQGNLTLATVGAVFFGRILEGFVQGTFAATMALVAKFVHVQPALRPDTGA